MAKRKCKSGTTFVHVKDILKDTIKLVDRLYGKKESITGLPTGFTDLDMLTTGFHPGGLIVVGARPGMGKTSFCLNIAAHVGIEVKIPIAIFSLDISKELAVLRMICSEAEVDSKSVRSGYHTKKDCKKLVSAADKLAEAPIFINDTFSMMSKIKREASRLKAEHGLGLIIIDGLQVIREEASHVSKKQKPSNISSSLKELANDLVVPVIVTSQINKCCEQRGEDKHPLLSDLMDSGTIEQDADTILFLYRGDCYRAKDAEKRVADLDIAKQKNDPTKRIKLTFIDKFTKFKNYANQ